MTRRGRLVAVLALLMIPVVAACATSGDGGAPGSTGTTPGTPRTAATVDFSAPGPYQVGTTSLRVGTTTAVVYYPADPEGLDRAPHLTSYSSGDAFGPELRALVAALVPELVQDIPVDAYRDARVNREGPFPVIVHSHGLGGFNLFGSHHFAQLASWGFVVAAPDHPSRDLAAVAGNKIVSAGDSDVADLMSTLDALQAQNTMRGRPLTGGLDTERVGTEGHAAGGRASYLFATKDARVKAWIGQAPSAPVTPDAGDEALSQDEQLARQTVALQTAPSLGKPAMIVAAEKDTVLPLAGIQAFYAWLSTPKRMLTVRNAGHAGFIDLCPPIREQGGVQKYAEKLPALAPVFQLADDGCGPDNTDPAKQAAFIDHVMIAQYRYVFGLDRTDASLAPEYLRRQFPEAFGGEQVAR